MTELVYIMEDIDEIQCRIIKPVVSAVFHKKLTKLIFVPFNFCIFCSNLAHELGY